MLSIYKFISPNEKVIKITEVKIAFYAIKGISFWETYVLLLLWWDRNGFYYPDSDSKYEINLIKTDFGKSGSYGSIVLARCLGHNTWTCLNKVKRDNATPIQGDIL